MHGCAKDCLILIPFRLPPSSCFTLSLKRFSSDSDNHPAVGIGPLLQFPHPPRAGLVLRTLLFSPLVPSAYRVLKVNLQVTQPCPTLCDPMDSPWNSPGQNTGVGSLFLLQQIFPTQQSKKGLLHCRWNLYLLTYQGSPWVLHGSIYSFPLVRYSCLLSAGVLHALLCLKVHSWCIRGERCTPHPPTPPPSCSLSKVNFWEVSL